jgi:hypothetical protein
MSMGTLGKLTLTAAGTPQKISATQLNVRGFLIETVLGNTGAIYIGNSALVKATLAGCFRVIPAPTATTGATILLPAFDHIGDVAGPVDLSTWFFDGDHTGDSILVAYMT